MNLFGGGIMFTLVPAFISIIAVLVIGVFVAVVISGIRQWHNNNHSPQLTVGAVVTGKRTEVRGDEDRTSTRYYATFEVESGDRMEFAVNGREYGLLSEGDSGFLTFQGTRYLGFERESR